MNDDAGQIRAALDRRFSRVTIPPCPDAAWNGVASPRAARGSTHLRRFAYAAALLVAVAGAGLGGAQAAGAIKDNYPKIFAPFVSTKPLQRIIHKADELTVAQAQRRISFPIVMPTGLPANTTFLYAHVISEQPIARVSLVYQAHMGGKYYRLNFNESDSNATRPGPAVVRFKLMRSAFRGNVVTKAWNIPERRWKHGSVFMSLVPWGLPENVTDGIVRANTM